jgi:hypothetical protein
MLAVELLETYRIKQQIRILSTMRQPIPCFVVSIQDCNDYKTKFSNREIIILVTDDFYGLMKPYFHTKVTPF